MSCSSTTPVVAVSHKAYFGARQTVDWCTAAAEIVRSRPAVRDGAVQVIVLPAAPMLPAALQAFAGTGVQVGAQDLHWEPGAWTGAIAGPLLAELGCTVAEVGHAERRTLGDTDDIVARKTAAAVAADLTPLVCVGEPDPVGVDAAAAECLRQLAAALSATRSRSSDLLVAYEPGWAIGVEAPAPPEHVDGVCRRIAEALPSLWTRSPARVLYGGSAGPGLLDRLGPAVAGLFLGRFAHDVARLATVLDETAARAARPAQ